MESGPPAGIRHAVQKTWNAADPNARARIRQSIAETLPGLLTAEKETLLNLDKRPDLAAWSVSISHCELGGGWVAVSKPSLIGFDMEQSERIRLPILQRMCEADEITAAPDPKLLWPAKEALFKSFPAESQPPVISGVRVSQWSMIENGLWKFSAGGAAGFVCEDGPLLYAVAIRK